MLQGMEVCFFSLSNEIYFKCEKEKESLCIPFTCTYPTLSHSSYPFLDWKPVLGTYANSADPVQTSQNMTSDQGLHCLRPRISKQNTIKERKRPPISLKLQMDLPR